MAALFTVLALAACQNAATTPPTQALAPPTQALAPPAADLPPQYARFHGVWSGKWDDTWDVTFVIDDLSSDGHANGHYYWKENVPGAWNHHTTSGEIRGNAVIFGVMTITIDAADSSKAVAVGKFETHTRTAQLTKL